MTNRDAQHSFLIPHSSFLVAALRLALVLALVGGIVGSVIGSRPRLLAETGRQQLWTGEYNAAQTTLESALAAGDLGALAGDTRLALSAAYLARRNGAQAAYILRDPLTSPDPLLQARAWVQQGRIAAWEGQAAAARVAWQTALQIALPADERGARARRAAQWHLAEQAWQGGDAGAVAQFQALRAAPAPLGDPYVAGAALRLAQISNTTAAQPDPAAVRALHTLAPPDPALGDAPFLNLPGQDEGLPPETWLLERDGLDSALADALALPALSPASHAAFWGTAWVRMGEWTVAARLLAQAVAGDPTLADAYAYLGLADQRLGQRDRALAALETAVRLAPDRPLGHHLLARFFLDTGDLTQAGTQLDWLEAHQATPLLTLLDRARWDRLTGDQLAAEQAYLAAEQQSGPPSGAGDLSAVNPSLFLAQFYLEYATWACAQGQPAAVRAVAAHPGPAELDALGWAAHLCYDEAGALGPLQQAGALAPHDPQIAYHLGVVLQALGQPAAARAAFLRAADYDPGGPWERRARAALAGLQE